MIGVVKENSVFTIGWAMFLALCLAMLMLSEQGDLIRFFADNRSIFGDNLFKYGTLLGEEPAYVIIVIFLLFVGVGRAIITGLTGIVVMISAYPLKHFFSHPRPKLFFEDLGELSQLSLVEGVELHGQFTSFPSGHTMSAFALYGILSLMFGQKNKVLAFVFISCAILVALSRVYLMQHFVKDIFVGAVLGYLVAIVMYALLQRLERFTFMKKKISF